MIFRKIKYYNYLFPVLLLVAGCNTAQKSNPETTADTSQPVLRNSESMNSVNQYSDSNATASPEKNETSVLPSSSATDLTYVIIPAKDNTYGYDIFKQSRLIIHQPNIPAVPGNSGFTTKELAASVARLVIEKVSKGEMPPTVSTDELKKLGLQVSK